jgi:hypothetical protein
LQTSYYCAAFEFRGLGGDLKATGTQLVKVTWW